MTTEEQMSEGEKDTWGGGTDLDRCIERMFKLARQAGFNVKVTLSRPRRPAKKKAARK